MGKKSWGAECIHGSLFPNHGFALTSSTKLRTHHDALYSWPLSQNEPFLLCYFCGSILPQQQKEKQKLSWGHFTFFHGFWVGASTFKDSLPLLQFVSMTFEENAFPVLCEQKLLETSCVCRTWWTDQNAALWKDWNVDPLPFPHLKARSLTLSWASSIPLEQPFPVHLNLNLN